MTSIVTDFKSIARKLHRQEQKADFEAKNPKEEQSAYEASTGMWGWPYGLASSIVAVAMYEGGEWMPVDQAPEGSAAHAVKFADGSEWDEINGWRKPTLKSLAHPEWPYQGTGFEWAKFVKVKI